MVPDVVDQLAGVGPCLARVLWHGHDGHGLWPLVNERVDHGQPSDDRIAHKTWRAPLSTMSMGSSKLSQLSFFVSHTF